MEQSINACIKEVAKAAGIDEPVTGHSSIAMLKKYIKADEIDRARTIQRDEAFAKW